MKVNTSLVVTIDGPAGAGKSTIARALARTLGMEFLDTGAMYRAVTLAAQRAGVAHTAPEELSRLLHDVVVTLNQERTFLNEEDVSQVIRAESVTSQVSYYAAVGTVRDFLTACQRAFAQGRAVVTEGRDQGTVVFPDAMCKFFLTANLAERARRRQRDYARAGRLLDIELLQRELSDRDTIDSGRTLAPLRAAPDAIVLDTSTLDPDAVLNVIANIVRPRLTNSTQK